MSKKILALLLVAACSVLSALPATAWSVEAHWEGLINFTGTFGPVVITENGEPVDTCDGPNHETGVVSSGGTTGTIALDLTACHTTVFGITTKCRTSGSALDNTVTLDGVFHTITASNQPALLMTLSAATIVCAGISNVALEGNLIGTFTSPACGVESKEATVSFSSTGSTQNHLEYTGVKYDLTGQTSGGSKLTAGLTATTTLASEKVGKLNCT